MNTSSKFASSISAASFLPRSCAIDGNLQRGKVLSPIHRIVELSIALSIAIVIVIGIIIVIVIVITIITVMVTSVTVNFTTKASSTNRHPACARATPAGRAFPIPSSELTSILKPHSVLPRPLLQTERPSSQNIKGKWPPQLLPSPLQPSQPTSRKVPPHTSPPAPCTK